MNVEMAEGGNLVFSPGNGLNFQPEEEEVEEGAGWGEGGGREGDREAGRQRGS